MAWTQAARDAAAAARQAHAGQKQHFAKQGKMNIAADTSKDGRTAIANQLRSIRKGKMADFRGHTSDSRIHSVVSNAAASTRLRNIGKQGSGMKHAKAASKSKSKK